MTEPRTLAWAAPYAGLDDDALKALGNAGLLRRARKDTVTEVSHDPKGAVLDVSGATVRVDGRGPAAVSCDCPTAGVCQHVLTACLWAVGVAPEVVRREPGPGPDGLSEVPGDVGPDASLDAQPDASSDAQPESGLGAPVVAQSVPRSSGSSGSSETSGPSGVRKASGRRGASEALLRRRREALAEVRDVVGRLMSGGLSHLGSDDAEPLRALAGRVRLAGFEHVAADQVGAVRLDGLLRVAAGLVAGLAGRDDAIAERELLDAFAEVWAMCEVLERALDTDARAGTGAGTAEAAAGGADRNSRVGHTAPDRGARRRAEAADEVDVARWVPLGARWWTSQSGSRGLAYLGWDDEGGSSAQDPGAQDSSTRNSGTRTSAGQVRQVVTGRPSGTDPRFQRSWTSPLLWGRSLSGLCEGPLTLSAVRVKADGTLGAGGSPVVRRWVQEATTGQPERGATGLAEAANGGAANGGAGNAGSNNAGNSRAGTAGVSTAGFDLDELLRIAERTGAGVSPRDVVGFGRRPVNVQLVLVRDVGEVGVDEVRQEMTLGIVTADGRSRMLRLPVTDEPAVETLLSVRSKLVAVTIERREDRDEPVGLFVRDKGAIKLISPTVTPAWTLESSYWTFWRTRIRKLKAQASAARSVRRVPTRPSPVRRVAVLLGDVLVGTAATGRPVLTSRQRSDVEQARDLARDLGLTTLERTAGGLLRGELTPSTLLHAAFVVGRARAVADLDGGR